MRERIPEKTALLSIRIQRPGYVLKRKLEFAERRVPVHPSPTVTREENWNRILREIGEVGSLNRGDFGFPIFNILARKQLGIQDPKDRGRLFEMLELIERRVDCSDFLVCGLMRYMHRYEMDQELKDRTKQVLLNYRYWMDMDGADAMCFWSRKPFSYVLLCSYGSRTSLSGRIFSKGGNAGQRIVSVGEKTPVSVAG